MNLVQIKVTLKIKETLKNALSTLSSTTNEYKQLENALTLKSDYISADIVHLAYKILNQNDNHDNENKNKKFYFHELLAGCDLFVPEYREPERNNELAQRCEQLKAEQSNREYREMTKNVDLSYSYRTENRKINDSILPDMRSVQGQLITIVNVVVTILCAFLFGYKAIEYSTGNHHPILQITFGLFCSILVAIADFYFLLKRFKKLD